MIEPEIMRERDAYTRYPRSILWLIQGGETVIGGPDSATGPPLRVEVDSFYLSKVPITNEQMEAYDPGYERSPLSPGDRDTAVGVSYEDAAAYCAWYAAVSRKPMRLPTEIEWEHACRAGAAGPYFWGNDVEAADTYLWDAENSDGGVRPPDGKRHNEFGLYGMLGGVWEWTEGCVLRGGSFKLHRSAISCSLRRIESPDIRHEDVGFRVAKSMRSGLPLA